MGSNKSHDHKHCAHTSGQVKQKYLIFAISINLLLTVAQLIGGYLADSLSLVADALHNFGDAGALIVALVAHKIAQRPVNERFTYGYRRAEILGALVNGVALVVVATYLLYSGLSKLWVPVVEVDAKIVIIVAGVALIIDAITAGLMYKGSADNINMRAAFLHNLMDAMTSFVVMLSGFAIMFFEIYRIDAFATLVIAVYIIWHTYPILKKSILILMQSAPENLNVPDIKASLLNHGCVKSVQHIHLWQLDDKNTFFEGQIVLSKEEDHHFHQVKLELKKILQDTYGIEHATFDFCLGLEATGCHLL